jgi:hypothetical protein
MAAEEDFVLSFTGEETDNLLKHTESMKNQTTEEDGETVQVYDTNGVPHKVSKTELLKKSTLALPALEDISSFVAINAAGNAVGVMTKEQVASVLAELIGIATPQKNGLLSKDGFMGRSVSDLNSMSLGVARFYQGTLNIPPGLAYDNGIAVCFTFDNVRCQFAFSSMNGLYFRVLWDYWFEWKQIG